MKAKRIIWRLLIIAVFIVPKSFVAITGELGYWVWRDCEAMSRWMDEVMWMLR